MQEMVLIKGPNNSLHPATEEDAQKLAKYKIGRGVRLKATQMSEHNTKFHQKIIMLFRLCYERFEEQAEVGLEYRGRIVKPSFDHFREELVILAGHYTVSHSLNGSVRVHATSLAYNNTTDEEKEKIYSDVINAALKHVYQGGLSEDKLRNMVEQIMRFDN